MGAVAFDTLRFVHRLRDSGFSETQAEAVAEAVKEVQDGVAEERVTRAELHNESASLHSEFATFQDEVRTEFAAVRSEMKSEFAAVRAEMREMELRLKYDLTVRLGAMMAAFVAIMTAVMKFLLLP
ncbi:MAG: coiled-coil domain-containing protein [Alphaproteobacteria bacterium]